MEEKIKHNPTCLYQVQNCDCGAREKLMPAYIKRKKKILKRMEDEVKTIYIDKVVYGVPKINDKYLVINSNKI